ncbi:hypothetical protein SDC9_203959 [bioreactor metagenome]|uniref:Uncharacterized protein n=1 Tax=bioreactor metagenome TaxID=1076179 RepID=A0A645J9T1_9ZZZZ
MPDNSFASEGPYVQFISLDNYFYNGWFYKKVDFQEFTDEFLDIIKSNENYILENPDVLKD